MLREDGKLMITNDSNEEIWLSYDDGEKESQLLDRIDNQLLSVPDQVGQTTSGKITYEDPGLLLITEEFGFDWEEGNLLNKQLEGFDVIWRSEYSPCYECEWYWEDGNLVIGEKNGGWRWESDTSNRGHSLQLTEQGEFLILDEFGNEVWRN